jgi:hypothetical protein
MTIRGHGEGSDSITTELVATLAREILADANLAIKSMRIQSLWASATEATFYFDTELQGKDVDFSRLREADLPISSTTPSFWIDAVLHNALQLQDLSLSVKDEHLPDMIPTSWTPSFALKSFQLLHSKLSASLMTTLLFTSTTILTSLKFTVVSLSESQSTLESLDWPSLLQTLSTCLPSLTHWKFKLLSFGTTAVKFPELSKQKLDEGFRQGLEVFVKGKKERGDERIGHVGYEGEGAGRQWCAWMALHLLHPPPSFDSDSTESMESEE